MCSTTLYRSDRLSERSCRLDLGQDEPVLRACCLELDNEVVFALIIENEQLLQHLIVPAFVFFANPETRYQLSAEYKRLLDPFERRGELEVLEQIRVDNDVLGTWCEFFGGI